MKVEDAEQDWDAPDVVIRQAGEDAEYIQIDRPFASVGKVDVMAVLTEIGATGTIGGLVVLDEQIMPRHVMRLSEALELDEDYDNALKYEIPLAEVIDAARKLGRRLAGHDSDWT
ncbi:hypothetical protein C8258_19875 [Nocardia sp. MDA0666]|uniref:hypothetical protein n=1 Tax=Nocardia sp. MDA0666 TaxID=2135448 RepID=UPI000D1316AB|nr:hypothetical protein [Nocardia sp. MDA0666]PSR66445.1 hypothetical protein C8258_19875 [Nocardia sp. MDA0666]